MTRIICGIRMAGALALGSAAVPALAQNTFFPNNATIDTTITGDVYVGYANFDDFLNSANGTSPTVTMVAGGSVGSNMQTFNASIFDMFDGSIGLDFGNMLAYDHSTVNMWGGLMAIDVETQHFSTFNMNGGEVGDDVTLFDSSIANLNHGLIDHSLLSNGTSTINMRGASVTSEIFIQDASTLNVYGSNLAATLTDPNFQGGFYSQYSLTGTLQDGTNLGGRLINVQNGSGAGFTLNPVPEPASLVALGLGAAALIRRRRRRIAK